MQRLDRRIPFFLFASFACFLLRFAADAKLRYVPTVVGATYLVLAILFQLEWLSRRAEVKRSGHDKTPEFPI
jgi:predicted membrane-bound mannosyltransferase